jgi:hypothetical protein
MESLYMHLNTLCFSRASKAEIHISLFDFDHLTYFEAPMFDKWLDFMLVHTFAQNVASSRGMYLLLNAQVSRLLKMKLRMEDGQCGGGKVFQT